MRRGVLTMTSLRLINWIPWMKRYTLPLWDLLFYLSQVLEVRQLVGVDALSKGLASFKLINEMKRNATIDDSGFMLTQKEQVWVQFHSFVFKFQIYLSNRRFLIMNIHNSNLSKVPEEWRPGPYEDSMFIVHTFVIVLVCDVCSDCSRMRLS